MKFEKCDHCGTEIASTWPTVFRLTEPTEAEFCSATHLRLWLEEQWPESARPDFDGTRRVLAEAGQVSQLPVPATAGQRITAKELAEVHEFAALDDAIDHGLLDEADEAEPVEVDEALAAYVRSLPKGRRSHTMLAADVALRMQQRLEGKRAD